MTRDEVDEAIREAWRTGMPNNPQWHTPTVFIGDWVRCAYLAGAERADRVNDLLISEAIRERDEYKTRMSEALVIEREAREQAERERDAFQQLQESTYRAQCAAENALAIERATTRQTK